jgi:hypothetical protein
MIRDFPVGFAAAIRYDRERTHMSRAPEQKPHTSCIGCGNCGLDDRRPPGVGELGGWRLAASAGAVFLLPLVLAGAGAMAFGSGQVRQLLGALVGLGVGLAGGVLLARLLCRSAKEPA